MKKKILSGVFALAVLATAGYGVNKSIKSDAGLSDLALSNVEALASESEGIIDWWNSKIYDCEERKCEETVNLGIISWTWEGTYEKCISGNSAAHCWNCKRCDAGTT